MSSCAHLKRATFSPNLYIRRSLPSSKCERSKLPSAKKMHLHVHGWRLVWGWRGRKAQGVKRA